VISYEPSAATFIERNGIARQPTPTRARLSFG